MSEPNQKMGCHVKSPTRVILFLAVPRNMVKNPKNMFAEDRIGNNSLLFTPGAPPHIRHTTQLLRQSAVVPCSQSLPSDERTVLFEATRITSVMQSITATGATRWQPRRERNDSFLLPRTQTHEGKSMFSLTTSHL